MGGCVNEKTVSFVIFLRYSTLFLRNSPGNRSGQQDTAAEKEITTSYSDVEYPPAVFIQNGETVDVDLGYLAKERSAPPSASPPKSVPSYEENLPPEPETITVYVTNTGEKYHSAGCQYLRKSSIPISLENAKLSYSPCSKCYPPV